MNTSLKIALAAALSTAMLAGCATTGGGTYGSASSSTQQDGMSQTKKGALIGAAVGAVAGLLSGDDATERRQRALVGAGVGGLTGGAIGNYQDRQERALREKMAGTGVEVVRQGDNITLNMPSNITFGFDRADLQPQFYPVLNDVAATLTEYNQTIVEVAGHTDSVGTDSYNQQLSERRAASVGNYLMSKGVMRDRFILVGAGETRPVASNDTESGRAQNRRVEITLVPLRS
ncbi:outer membrane protein OmpA-like peptidoglycan-associated protein [Lysobacter ruishenii]|uniref:Outer membrane protein OmpA-like peptidoglycan-associated protein n=2 Tax=Aerolutibacter ruishenii TaxID=686800 RepID=A0A562LYS4_9GAMM|nr:OmpA family protein [Lysobacter ruishenii]TWI12703.1 outer membrane protein OmpA-like peptidoglycan-associated protein [Lysobacter ruishenii]